MIVSDEPLLDTLEKIMRTNKQLCLPLKEDIDWVKQFSANFREGSLEQKLYAKLIERRTPCCLSDYAFRVESIRGKDFFILHSESSMTFLSMFNSVFKQDISIGSDRPFMSPLAVYYLSKAMNKQTRTEFNRQTHIYLQNGYKIKAFREANQMFDRHFARIKPTFRNAGEYVKHYTMITDVEIKDFRFVYPIYIVWSLVLFALALRRFVGKKVAKFGKGNLACITTCKLPTVY